MLSALAFSLFTAQAPPSPACDAVWEAKVVDAGTGVGVPNAVIELLPADAKQPVVVRTGDEGSSRVGDLCRGTMRVVVTKAEHARLERQVELVDPVTVTTLGLEALHEHHSESVERVVIVHDDRPTTMLTSEHISGAELAQTRGVGLADTLERVSGVTALGGTAGGMAKPMIRGQVGRRNLIVFDGIRHEGQKWGIDHAPEVDPYAAGRITVIKGAATTRFGPDAIGGAVLVDPRPLLRSPGVGGEVSSVGSSNALGGGGAARIDHAPLRLKGFAWRAEANIARHRAVLTPDYPLDNTGALTWNAGGRAGYLSEPFDIEVGYRVMRLRAGICSCLRLSSPEEFTEGLERSRPIGAEFYTPDFEIERAFQDVWHHLAMARARVELGQAGELHATYAYQYNDRKEFDVVRESITGPQLTFGLGTHTGGLRYEQPSVPLGREWALVGTIGANVSHQRNDFEAATTLIPDYQQWSGGVFAVERFVHERVELEVGGRYEGLDRTAQLAERDYLGQYAGGRLEDEVCERTDDRGARCTEVFHTPSATAGVLVRPVARAPEFSVRLELNSSARTPAIDEQFMNGAAPSFPILGLGDSRLGIERTWGGTTTAQYAGDWLLVEASGYANYIDDYINFTPEPQEGQCAPLTCTTRGPLPVFAFKAVDALFAGAELRVDLRMPELPFEVSGNAAWVRARDLTGNGFVSLVPPDRYTLAGRYLWPDSKVSARGYLELNGTFVARQRRYDPEADFAAPPPGYVLLGAGAGVEFPGKQHLMRLSLRGSNLLNQRYRDYTSLLRYFVDKPGWALTLRFSIEWSAPLGDRA